MEENYLFSLFVFFLFSLVFFKKDNKISLDRHHSKQSSENSGISGVTKYLQDKQGIVIPEQQSGVAKYLQEKQDLEIQNSEKLTVSGVEKYLANKKETDASGVSKYMARQAVLAKK